MSENFKERVIKVWKERRPDIKSVRKLEIEIGLSNGSIASWSKSEPSKEKIEKIADFFKVPINYLLGRDDNLASSSSNNPKYVDLSDEDIIMAFNGKPISDKYRRAIKAFLEEDDD